MDKIDALLLKCGMPPSLKGFRCWEKALELQMKDDTYSDFMTTSLYPHIADCLGGTEQQVERAMRYAVETCFSRMPAEVVDEIFGRIIDPMKGKATNTEFLTALYLQLKD